jgi:hypothetical protein
LASMDNENVRLLLSPLSVPSFTHVELV